MVDDITSWIPFIDKLLIGQRKLGCQLGFTREQQALGGRISGVSKRFKTRNRDAAIRRLKAEGASAQELAEHYGMTRQNVGKIVRRGIDLLAMPIGSVVDRLVEKFHDSINGNRTNILSSNQNITTDTSDSLETKAAIMSTVSTGGLLSLIHI